MSNVAAGILILLVNLVGWADAPGLKEARERWLRGNYAEAKSLYEKLAKEPAARKSCIFAATSTGRRRTPSRQSHSIQSASWPAGCAGGFTGIRTISRK